MKVRTARCQSCNNSVRVKKDNTASSHLFTVDGEKDYCPGIGLPVVGQITSYTYYPPEH